MGLYQGRELQDAKRSGECVKLNFELILEMEIRFHAQKIALKLILKMDKKFFPFSVKPIQNTLFFKILTSWT